MKEFKIASNHNPPHNIKKVIEDCFGEINFHDIEKQIYSIENPYNPILESVKIQVNDESVNIDINEIPLEKAMNQNIVDSVVPAVQAKNELLEKLTGKSVSDRKQEMREDIKYPNQDI